MNRFAVAMLGAGLAACSGVDAALRDSTGAPLATTPPVQFRLAVGPATQDGDTEADRLRDEVVRWLEDLEACSAVFAVATPDAAAGRADLYLQLHPATSTPADHPAAHLGTSGAAVPVAGLWLTTWFGGFLLRDSAYRGSLVLQCDFLGADDGRSLGRLVADPGTIELSYFERNPFPSWSFLQTLVLPPFWTTDDPAATRQAVAQRSLAAAAGRIAAFLKEELEPGLDRDAAIRLRLLSPNRNGAQVENPCALEFQLLSRQALQHVTVHLDTDRNRVLAVHEPRAVRMGVDLVHNLRVALPTLAPGRHLLMIQARGDDGVLQRTLRFTAR